MEPISIVAGIFLCVALGMGIGASTKQPDRDPNRGASPEIIQEIKACRLLCGKNRTLEYDREAGLCTCINSK